MNTDAQNGTAEGITETRPLYWSIRRELWEHRSLYLAPLIIAGVVLFANLIMVLGLPKKMRAAEANPAKYSVAGPIKMAPAPIMLTTIIIGMYYCLDALYGERRDRSILFWKSLPVSDRTIVLSKAAVPIVVLPAIAYALSVATQIVILFASTIVLAGSGINPAKFWVELRFFELLLIMAYGLVVHALWFTPIYGWLLLVSAWARRAPFLWAVIPILTVSAFERTAFGTMRFMKMMQYRVGGAMKEAFGFQGKADRFSELSAGQFFTAPGLWVGLLFFVVCLALAVRLRRNREPI